MGEARERAAAERPRRSERKTQAAGSAVATASATGPALDGMGNRALLALLRADRSPRKPPPNGSGDRLEREADRVAARILRMPDPAPRGGGAAARPPLLARPARVNPVPAIVDEVLRTPGRPLDGASRAFFEPRFGHDLSEVRVHADQRAAASAAAVAARAFTSGRHIVFNAGVHRPQTPAGRAVLAHELAHVVQQSMGHADGIQRQPLAPIPIAPSERRPDVAAPAGSDLQGPITDVSIVRVEDENVFNQDERYHEHRKREYGEGWMTLGDGRQKKVSFVTETVTHKPFDSWGKAWTAKGTTLLYTEPQYRSGRTPIRLVTKTVRESESFKTIPPKKPQPKSSGGVLSSVGGFFKNVGRFFKGVGKSLWGVVEGLYHLVRHPIQTLKGLYTAVRHPVRTLKALGRAIEARFKAIASGDYEALGQTLGDIATLIFAPEAALAKAPQVVRGIAAARGLEAAGAVRALEAAGTVRALEAAEVGVVAARAEDVTTVLARGEGAAVSGVGGEATRLERAGAGIGDAPPGSVSGGGGRGPGPPEDIRGIVVEDRNIVIRGEPDVPRPSDIRGTVTGEGGIAIRGADEAAAATRPTISGSPRPGRGETLVGSSEGQMSRAAQRIIRDDPNHPLRFLLDANGEFKPQRGLRHSDLANRPDLVQMGHITSKKLGETDRLMLQGAWENQLSNLTIERANIGGAVLEQTAISIGGIAVDVRTARYWEGIGWLPAGTVERAPLVIP